MNKTTHPFLQLLVLFVLCFGLMGASTVVMFVAAAFGVDIQGHAGLLTFQAFSQLVSFVGPVALVLYLYHRGEERSFLRADGSRAKWLLALVGLVVWVLFMPLMDWSTVWNDGWHFGGPFEVLERLLRKLGEQSEAVMQQLLAGTGVGSLLANLLVIALMPALCEELFFRAGMQNLMLRWARNPHVAIWVTAAVFSLFHGEVFAFVPRFIMGAILGYLYFGSNSLVPNMLAHFLNNAVVVVTYWLSARGVVAAPPDEPLMLAWPITLGCTVAALAILYVAFGKNLKISR